MHRFAYTLTDLNIGQCVELTFFEGRFGSLSLNEFVKFIAF